MRVCFNVLVLVLNHLEREKPKWNRKAENEGYDHYSELNEQAVSLVHEEEAIDRIMECVKHHQRLQYSQDEYE